MPAEPFAATDDVEAAWRPLSEQELIRANALIDRASRKIRRRWSDVDSRIAAGTLEAEAVTDVVAEMVQVAMTQTPGVAQSGETAGPFASNVTYTNPNSRLYFTDDMLEVFDGPKPRMRLGWLA